MAFHSNAGGAADLGKHVVALCEQVGVVIDSGGVQQAGDRIKRLSAEARQAGLNFPPIRLRDQLELGAVSAPAGGQCQSPGAVGPSISKVLMAMRARYFEVARRAPRWPGIAKST